MYIIASSFKLGQLFRLMRKIPIVVFEKNVTFLREKHYVGCIVFHKHKSLVQANYLKDLLKKRFC